MGYARAVVSLGASLIAGLDRNVCLSLGDFKCAIIGTVVHDNEFDITMVLLSDAQQATLDRTFGIAGWYHNRNERQLNPSHKSRAGKPLVFRETSGNGTAKR